MCIDATDKNGRLTAALSVLVRHDSTTCQRCCSRGPPTSTRPRTRTLSCCGKTVRRERQGTSDDDKPTLTLFPVRSGWQGPAPTTAVIIAPGGSYERLAANHEGRQVANWFNAQGVTAFVLRYRLGPRYHHPIEMQDAQRAIRFVRATRRGVGGPGRSSRHDGVLRGRPPGFHRGDAF